MTRHLPFIEASVDGRPVSAAFYKRLSTATITDAPGQEADTCELKFDDAGNEVIMPPKGARLTVKFGFEDDATFKMGVFRVEKSGIEGGKNGEFVTLSGRSADMREDIKEPLSEHFDDTTVAGIVEELAGRHGFDAKVDGELAGIAVPYRARINQSAADFLSRLADETGGFFSVKDGKFLMMRRGSLPAITIDKSECESWSFEVEPRPRFGQAEAGWFERRTGKTHFESFSTPIEGPVKRLLTLFPNAAEAKAAARSEGEKQTRATGSGSLERSGMPEIMADTPIVLTGFRPEANGLWRAGTVTHTYSKTYMTSIALEAPEEGKS